ncbi:hypothetical protein Lesp02_19590 [Lentzea sp. NBRC 105346]|uniref:FAD-binding protein n=1 Tax=Lentzea sp. NBRC 105346 TaxID=3032205 RepID=UPI0024A59D2D|nr:FAD-binding protein [Lentzea sp. NBRC 105346]GLZ29769.1 hypothetical protein Lesp02_19590 [Lentzea sp. NBRC 105346]
MITSQVAVVGGGIAGAWLSYRLAQRGVDTVLVVGPEPPVSREWAACVLNRQLVEDPVRALEDSSGTQDPALRPLIERHLPRELAELRSLVELMPFEGVLIPRHQVPMPRLGAGDEVVTTVLRHYAGRMVEARVTDLVVRDGVCHGVRTDRGSIAANHVVLASGGFSGLFADGVANSSGALLGTCLRHGATLANLELFQRFALGDRTRRRPLYPFDLDGARLLRDGSPIELRGTDLALFREYWTSNLGVPHTAQLKDVTVELGPVRGFSYGGLAGGIENLHATGEARYDIAADALAGLPWLVFLATGGMLAERLEPLGKPSPIPEEPVAFVDFPDLRARLAACFDHNSTSETMTAFLRWARENRGSDVLLLAEACVASALARTESRGFFFRADHPAEDPGLAGRTTRVQYRDGDIEVQL